MNINKLSDTNVTRQRVLIRVDMNVPIADGKISDDSRIRASLPSIIHCLNAGAGVILMTHLGRPKEGQLTPQDSVAPIAEALSTLLAREVNLIVDWQHLQVMPGQLLLLENVRGNVGEKANDAALGKRYAALCDIFVNDAFATAHRAEASTVAVAQHAPQCCAGLLMSAEIEAIHRALAQPARPLLAIVGGAKVSTKLAILHTLADKVDQLIVGGGIANTFLLAAGHRIGNSLAEPSMTETARQIMHKLQQRGAQLPLPIDVVTAKRCCADAIAIHKTLDELETDDMILDIGHQSAKHLASLVAQAGTIVWNGPLGVFELDAFGQGTATLAHAIADSRAFSLAGGGDTLAAIARYDIGDRIAYRSTGGGAFLALLGGNELPALAALAQPSLVH